MTSQAATKSKEVKKKWQLLRTNFSKILKRSPKNAHKIRWPYFGDMMFLLTPFVVPSMSTSKKIKTEKRQFEDSDTSSPSPAKRQRSNVHESEVPFADANEMLSAHEGTSEDDRNDFIPTANLVEGSSSPTNNSDTAITCFC